MRITASIIYYELKRSLPIERNRALFNDKTLKSSHIFMGELTSPNCAYVAKAEQLRNVSTDYMSIVALGEPDFDYIEKPVNLIIVPESSGLDIEHLQNEVQSIFDKYSDWTDEMFNITTCNMGAQAIFSASIDVLPFGMNLISADGTLIASTRVKETGTSSPLPISGFEGLSGLLSEHTGETDLFEVELPDGRRLMCANIFDNRNEFAAMVFSEPRDRFIVSDEQIVRYFVINVQHLYKRVLSGRAENSSDPVHELLTRMLFESSTVAQTELNFILRRVNWQPSDSYALINVDFLRPNQSDMTYSFLCNELESLATGSIAVRSINGIVYIINRRLCSMPLGDSFYRSVEIVFRDNIIRMGISSVFSDLRRLDLYYHQAISAIMIGEAINPDVRICKFEDYLLEFMLSQCCGEFDPEELLSGKLKLLRAYDRENDTEFVKTLRAFFDARYNATAAAQSLFIHRTTFLNRMRTIEELCELSLHDFDERLHLMLSFKLLDIIN